MMEANKKLRWNQLIKIYNYQNKIDKFNKSDKNFQKLKLRLKKLLNHLTLHCDFMKETHLIADSFLINFQFSIFEGNTPRVQNIF